MRHKRQGKKLNRNIKQRKALFKNLIQSLILKEEIKTTEAKAKAIKRLTDKLIFKAKTGSLHVRRQIMAFMPDRQAANKLVDDVAKRFSDRSGGFTKMVRLGRRKGDNTMMVKMELAKKAKKEAKAEDEKVKEEEKKKKGLKSLIKKSKKSDKKAEIKTK